MNYWLFQATPAKYKIEQALLETKDPGDWTWDVKQHKKAIKNGDKVIIWMNGKNAGVVALATIISDIQPMADRPGKDYAIDKQFHEIVNRVQLRIDANLVKHNKIIAKSTIISNKHTMGLKQGFRGTNFRASKEEYDAILSIIDADEIGNILEQLNLMLMP